MATYRIGTRSFGVSLIEALVALAVMAFGMLSLVGVQATLRLNSDVSKQRTEATRIASEEIENLRRFTVLNAVAAVPPGVAPFSYDDIVGRGPTNYVPDNGTGSNTTYSITTTVTPLTEPLRKVIKVVVTWKDRAGTVPDPSITLDGVIAGVSPALTGMLSVPARASATNQLNGRNATIPREAKDLGNGKSAFKPFDIGTVVWVFNNLTGMITSRCTGVTVAQAAILVTDLVTCETVDGRRLAGVVQFDLTSSPSALSPAGPALQLSSSTPVVFNVVSGLSPVNQNRDAECFSAALPTGFAKRYECLVFPADAKGWGGQLNVLLGSPLLNGTTGNDYQSCRYTKATIDFTLNDDHPKSYCMEKSGTATAAAPCTGKKVTGNLGNQNFLVIKATETCPADVAGDLINTNTLQHQATL